MNPLARGRAYALFSRLLLDGVDARTASRLTAIPLLDEALRAQPDLDELAAAHHTLFAFDAPPHAGAYLDPEGLVGGEPARALLELQSRWGFVGARADVSPDHLGVVLGVLSFGTQSHRDVGELLDTHLLPWLPAFATTATAHAAGFYRLVIELVVAAVIDHRANLPTPARTSELPPLPDLLNDAGTSLRRIARVLTTPALAGFYLTRRDIAAVGAALELPHGFGSRRNMLEHVLVAAAEYDTFGAATEQLGELLGRHHAALDTLRADYPTLAPWTAPWTARLTATRSLLDALRARAAASTLDIDPRAPSLYPPQSVAR